VWTEAVAAYILKLTIAPTIDRVQQSPSDLAHRNVAARAALWERGTRHGARGRSVDLLVESTISLTLDGNILPEALVAQKQAAAASLTTQNTILLRELLPAPAGHARLVADEASSTRASEHRNANQLCLQLGQLGIQASQLSAKPLRLFSVLLVQPRLEVRDEGRGAAAKGATELVHQRLPALSEDDM
jgi:hypothetical protein